MEMTTPSAISISQRPNSFFVTTGTFESRRKVSFRCRDPLSVPITTQAGKTCRFGGHMHPRLRELPRHPHLMPHGRNRERGVGRTDRRQRRLALMSLRELVSCSACIRWGDRSWWVVRKRANGGVNSPPLLETAAVA